jgi:hypothetical protein
VLAVLIGFAESLRIFADAQSVTRACCDDATGGCAAGVPAECDARCGIIYTDFFERCGSKQRQKI